MTISRLQKYILLRGLENAAGEVPKKSLLKFYARETAAPGSEKIKIITKSVERLIHRGLARGYGVKTKEKWFVESVALTPSGKKLARQFLGRQRELPFKKRIKK